MVAPGSSYKIAPATWRDLNALRQIEKACFPIDAWPLFDLIGVLTLPNVVRLKAVVYEKGVSQMVGFIAGDIHADGVAWIATIGVLPNYRGQGIGAALLTACENQLKAPVIRLCVRQSNEVAIHMYRRFGYTQADLWRGYYEDGENALVMEKRKI